MKGLLKKILSIFMSSVCAFSVLACGAGCKDDGKGNSNVGGANVGSVTFDGVHKLNYTETNEYLVKNGKCDYSVVIPKNATESDITGADEFVYLFNKATGIDLKIFTDEGLTYNAQSKYISIGETSLLATLPTGEIDKTVSDLGLDGLRIETVGKSIFIFAGNRGKGTLYGVYDFMQLTFNYEQYFYDTMVIEQNVKNKKLYDYKVKDIPDMEGRSVDIVDIYANTKTYDNVRFRDRMRMKSAPKAMPVVVDKNNPTVGVMSIAHNSVSMILPKRLYPDKLNKWYSTIGDQLCFTARGDAEEFELLAQEIALKIQLSLKLYTPDVFPEYTFYDIMIEDNANFCKCDTCAADLKKYGTLTGSAVKLINRVSDIVDEWMLQPENEPYKREDFAYRFFAYLAMETAPVRLNDKGEYEPIDDSVIPRDNVITYIALLDTCEYQKSIYDDVNSLARKNVQGWAAISKRCHYWLYTTNFGMYTYYYDTFDFFSDAFPFFAATNVEMFRAQSVTLEKDDVTSWHKLKSYIYAKLMWNCNLDINALIDNYFDAMYGVAGEDMKDLFYEIRQYSKHINEKFNLYKTRSNFNDMAKKEYWSLQQLTIWLNRFEKVKDKIAIYQGVDNEKYNRYLYHIESEAFSVLTILLDVFYNDMSDELKVKYVNTANTLIKEHNFSWWKEGVNMETFMQGLK